MVLYFLSAIAFSLSGVAATPAQVSIEQEQFTQNFKLCSTHKRINCVVDGDTFWLRGEKIRVADIDAPEIFSPKCEQELALGKRATQKFIQLLNQGPFSLRRNARNRDYFGRLLRTVTWSNRSLGAMLVKQKLARSWAGRRASWCL